MIRSYGSKASRAGRCIWMLEELAVPYENVAAEVSSDAFKTLNPNGRVPLLDDDGLLVFESMAINLHLAEEHPAGDLAPRGATERADALRWSFWGMTAIEPG